MKTLLVTGATGFIGRRLVVAAQAAGWRVIGLGRAAPLGVDEGREPGTGGQRTEDGGQTTDGGGRTTEDGRETTFCCSAESSAQAPTRGRTTADETLTRSATRERSADNEERKTDDGGRSRNADASRYGGTAEDGAGLVAAGYSSDWITADLAVDTPLELPPGIDAIIHLAGKAHALAEVAQDEAEYFRINTDGTRRLLEAAQRAGVRAFVLFSTVKAAGDRPCEGAGSEERGAQTGECGSRGCWNVGSPLAGGPSASEAVRTQGPTLQDPPQPETGNRNGEGGNQVSRNGRGSDIRVHPCSSVVPTPLDEFCPFPPDTPYGRSKRAAEQLVLEGGYVPHPVVIRPCLVYGPEPKGNLAKMIAAVQRGRFPPLPEVGNKRSMVHVDDVVAAALLAAEHPAAKGHVFIAADDAPFSTRQLFEWICAAAGRPVPRGSIPLWVLRGLGRVGDLIGKIRGRRFVFDSDALAKLTGDAWYTSAKLQRELGWRPRQLLRDTLPHMVRGACGTSGSISSGS